MNTEPRTAYPRVEKDLEVLRHAANYNRWLYTLCRPHLGTRILEIGSGIGNHTARLLLHGDVWATDCEDHYVAVLRRKFKDRSVAISKLSLDNWDGRLQEEVRAFRPDTVVCLNVLEHVEDDVASVGAMLDCLSPGGRLILIVPAMGLLFSKIDVNYGHRRRYDRARIEFIRGETGSTLLHLKHFNFVGALGWLWNYRIRGKEALMAGQIALFDRLVPFLAAAERRVPVPLGLSTIAVLGRGENV